MAQDTSLSNPRLVASSHSTNGTAMFTLDKTFAPARPFNGAAGAWVIFDERLSVPVSNNLPLEVPPQCVPKTPVDDGVVFSVVDFQPGFISPMHRTWSIDYGFVVSGEIVLSLDGGEEKTIRQGEFFAQGGANHKWENRGSKPCRITIMMLAAEPVTLSNGSVLPETSYGALFDGDLDSARFS